ncbi:hypothetical protein [Ranid herpesvirus 3]|uniref:Uncharacterized protein n=1 Tax=Ranid herpesvirus 3 TaxID=1987509 RepID=A0A1X9T5E2_9VIRU|nr:hypothetical protein [Ranid herpesvirus 3]ARR28924.1 hypothetical protein [Ranid herpesvirus 3]
MLNSNALTLFSKERRAVTDCSRLPIECLLHLKIVPRLLCQRMPEKRHISSRCTFYRIRHQWPKTQDRGNYSKHPSLAFDKECHNTLRNPFRFSDNQSHIPYIRKIKRWDLQYRSKLSPDIELRSYFLS